MIDTAARLSLALQAEPAANRAADCGLRASIPGLLLAAGLGGLAFVVQRRLGVSSLSPLIVAIALGATLRNTIGTPACARAGVALSLRPILRIAIVLLGLQLTFAQVAAIGGAGVLIIAACVVGTFLATKALGAWLGVERGLTELIAAGTSICGASAIVATNTVTRAPDEDVAYAIACVTVFGSIAMIGYPMIAGALDLPPRAYGLWAGASIHEVAQVVAASFQRGQAAGEFGTVAKLTRVMMLAPFVLALGGAATRRARRHGGIGAKPPMPWFVLGFLGMIALNSSGVVPPVTRPVLVQATAFLLAMALAAMGLETDVRRLAAKGARPLLLAAAASTFVAILALGLVLLVR